METNINMAGREITSPLRACLPACAGTGLRQAGAGRQAAAPCANRNPSSGFDAPPRRPPAGAAATACRPRAPRRHILFPGRLFTLSARQGRRVSAGGETVVEEREGGLPRPRRGSPSFILRHPSPSPSSARQNLWISISRVNVVPADISAPGLSVIIVRDARDTVSAEMARPRSGRGGGGGGGGGKNN